MIIFMRSSESPFLADWFVVSFRWLFLLGMILATTLAGQMQVTLGVLCLLSALWNIYASLLTILNRRLRTHRVVNATIDLVVSILVFFLTGGSSGSMPWVGILPFFTVSVYYGAFSSVITGIILTLVQALMMVVMLPIRSMFPVLLLVSAFNLLTSLFIGIGGHHLIARLRLLYKTQVRQKEDIERNAKQQEHDRLQAFYELTSTLSATLNYQTVLTTALDLGARAMDDNLESSDKMVSAFLLFEENQLKVGSSRRMGPTDQHVVLPGDQGVVSQAINNAEPQVVRNPSLDPELRRFVSLHNCNSCVCLALRSGVNVYGIFLFAHPDPNYFNSDRLEILDIMSRQATVAIQNARLYQNLALEQQRIVETQEEARRKLARDLHDGPTQSVAAIAMRVNFVRRLLEKDLDASKDELVKIEDLARRTTKEIRHMLFTLRPLVLETSGLIAALKAMADKMVETFDQNVEVNVDKQIIDQLEISKQTVIFYLAEEAVNNARKHAQASHIWVRLGFLPDEQEVALLEIQDDGVGFDVEAVNRTYEQRGSLGMVNLQERSELVNGLLNIHSTSGQGTSVQIYIPLTEEAADRLRRTV